MGDVVLLCGPGDSSWIVARALRARFGAVDILLEPKVPPLQLVWRRRRRLGTLPVVGQILFQLLAVPLLRRRARARHRELLQEWDPAPLPATAIPSVNAPEARERLQALRPRVVVVNGTRILGAPTLECVDAPFVNMHMGLTPAYRGSHGGYWALAEGHPELVGTTVHRVDTGIDTGRILEQARFQPGPRDNFTTYPLLHLEAGLPGLLRAVERELSGEEHPPVAPPQAGSRLHHHPTLWGYLWRGIP